VVKAPYLSIVIPAYNEAHRLPAYLQEIDTYFRKRNRQDQIEVVVVDDGSQDGTVAVLDCWPRQGFSLRVLRLPSNHGKGYAVRMGMLSARGELCLFADADGATPIAELARLEARIAQGAEVAIGSRALSDPTCVLQVRWHRKFFGRIFHLFVRALGIRGLADTQCGFKLFRHHAVEDIFSVLQLDGYGFDVELLFVAQRRGYRIAEVAINWADCPGSKVRVFKDGIRMLGELWTVRKNHRAGLYTRQTTPPSLNKVASLERIQ
jgi:dolichyl-phosphate beta-glucosyltransferase